MSAPDRRRVVGGLALVVLLLLGALWWLGSGGGADDAETLGTAGEAKRTRFGDGDLREPVEPVIVTAPELGVLGLEAHGTDPETVVTCAVEPALASASVQVIDDALPEIPEVARIEEGVLVIPAPRKSGTGVLKVEGYVPVPFSWSEGRCAEEPLRLIEGGAAVVGRVLNAEGEPEGAVHVIGCGTSVKTDVDGSYYLEGVPGRACTVFATRADGLLTTRSEEVTVTPEVNRDVVADLHLPPYRVGGLGIVVEATNEGFVIQRVLAGSASSDAALEAGDRVLSIDGEDVELLSLEEFVEAARGEVGTTVEVEVDRDGEVFRTELDRREM